MAPDPIFGGLPCIVPVYPWLELDRAVRNLSCRDGLDKKEFFFPGNSSPALGARDGGGFSPAFSPGSRFLRNFLCLVLSNSMKMKPSPDLGLLSKDSHSSKGQRLEEHPCTG